MAAFTGPVVVGDHQLHALETPSFERAEQILVGRLALGVGYLHGEDLPEAIVPHPRDDEDPLADQPPIHPHLPVASVHEQVGVACRFEPTVPPRLEL
jgi:hypothetical protein